MKARKEVLEFEFTISFKLQAPSSNVPGFLQFAQGIPEAINWHTNSLTGIVPNLLKALAKDVNDRMHAQEFLGNALPLSQ